MYHRNRKLVPLQYDTAPSVFQLLYTTDNGRAVVQPGWSKAVPQYFAECQGATLMWNIKFFYLAQFPILKSQCSISCLLYNSAFKSWINVLDIPSLVTQCIASELQDIRVWGLFKWNLFASLAGPQWCSSSGSSLQMGSTSCCISGMSAQRPW